MTLPYNGISKQSDKRKFTTQNLSGRHRLAWEVLSYAEGFYHISVDHTGTAGTAGADRGGDRMRASANPQKAGAAGLRILPAVTAGRCGSGGGIAAGAGGAHDQGVRRL